MHESKLSFMPYQHIERWGTTEVEGIECGTCLIFSKLDGTNASIWLCQDLAGPHLHAGSRTRLLSEGSDNAGFLAATKTSEWGAVIFELLQQHPNWRLFGEWLVPHTYKQYREETWRRFWIFDVFDHGFDHDTGRYLPYEVWGAALRDAGLDVIEPLAEIINPTEELVRRIVECNTYLVKDGAPPGEGVVIKRYGFRNRFGRETWAKLVRNQFKEENRRAFGHVKQEGYVLEAEIAERWVTGEFVQKTRAKIEQLLWEAHISQPQSLVPYYGEKEYFVRASENRKHLIPRLLATVFYDLVREETWEILKHFKNPTIDFKSLQRFTVAATKKHAPDLF